MKTKVFRPHPTENPLYPNPKGTVVEVELPEGWRRVWRGAVKEHDRFLNWSAFAETGEVQWETVDERDTKLARSEDIFTLLIRHDARLGPGPDLPCEACELEHRETGMRFCETCIEKGVHRQPKDV